MNLQQAVETGCPIKSTLWSDFRPNLKEDDSKITVSKKELLGDWEIDRGEYILSDKMLEISLAKAVNNLQQRGIDLTVKSMSDEQRYVIAMMNKMAKEQGNEQAEKSSSVENK